MEHPNRVNIPGVQSFQTGVYRVNNLGKLEEQAHRKYGAVGQQNGSYNLVCMRPSRIGHAGVWLWQAPCLVNWDHIMNTVEENDMFAVRNGMIDPSEIPYCKYMICNYVLRR